ncbi:hypothetical protein [Streptomyces sp. S.PB5]|uniref:hypothetical protein n=1 Tax=Streptomyces sp. S.PB5 TaxID=3020844 RepID=UPI0025AF59C4|nr:hypothetical protein [Streptomyces sp. S.PB5]MDN3028558.1 hypothetical protein [Streptomyces sp. S.PB5]
MTPIARQDPRLDTTALYVFRGERGTVLVTDHSHSLASEDVPRGLHSESKYEFKIDSNEDAVKDITIGSPSARPMRTASSPMSYVGWPDRST